MKWIPQDIEMFVNAKEYVDTIVIPLYPISFGDDVKQTANMTEFTNLLTIQLERQFKGRLILLQGFTYFKKKNLDQLISDLLEWENWLKEENFKHIFYVTSDSDWKIKEQQLGGSLIWLPALPLEHMEENQKNAILQDQVKQLLNLFTQRWRNEE
ncbi:YpiF family protein [Bacillus sp. CGMCC 1.16607]|uniref:YpiF family protein n=1 Tax=Bacillus sp. CGMCC 1.16607 TaxID=3351842 RepID=UPI003629F474